jgi:hypothetical protein
MGTYRFPREFFFTISISVEALTLHAEHNVEGEFVLQPILTLVLQALNKSIVIWG